MKNKKLVSLVLSGAMLLTNAFAGVAAEDANARNQQDVEIMTALGFMDKFSSTDVNLAVTRGEFAAAVCDVAGILNMSYNAESPFSDVNSAHKYFNEICLAAEYKIIKGKQNQAFHPDDTINFTEAATMLINALGYGEYAELNGGYPQGYSQIATSLGLYDNVDLTGKVTLGAAATMLKNAGHSQMLVKNPGGVGMSYEKTAPLFEERHDIFVGEGIVSGNEYTSIDSKTGVGEGMVKVGDTLATMYYSNLPSDYLGYNVEYYYRSNDEGEVMLYMMPEDTEVEIIKDVDIKNYVQNNIYYYDNGKDEHIAIPEDADIIYNGRMTTSYYVESDGVEKSIFKFDNGEVKLINNDNDSDIDVVNILSYDNYVVSSVNVKAEAIYDMYDEKKTIDYSKAENAGYSWIITDADGNLMNFSDVKEKDVVSVAKSADGEILRGVVNTDKAVGTLVSVSDFSDDAKVVIGNVEYLVHASYLRNNALPQVGSTVTALLDFEGKIAGFDKTVTTAGYGYFIKQYENEDEDTYNVRLLTQDGAAGVFKMAESVEIDGVRYKGAELNNKVLAMSGYCAVLYKMNEAKEIIMLDTESQDGGGESDVLRALSEDWVSSSYYNSVKNFSGLMIADAKTKVFAVPADEYKEDMSLYSLSSIPATEGGETMTFKGYVSTKDGFVPECIVMRAKGGGSMLVTSPYMIVEKVMTGLNNDDESALMFEGYLQSGEKAKKTVSAECKVQESYTVDPKTIVPGDIIKYVEDNKGEIIKVSPLKTMGREGFGIFKDGFTTWFSHAGYADFFGYLMARDGNYLAIVNTKEQLKGELKPDVCLTVDPAAGVYYISIENGKLTIDKMPNGDTTVLTDYVHSYQETPVIVTARGGRVHNIYVYEQQ